jgi:hypothetical protein
MRDPELVARAQRARHAPDQVRDVAAGWTSGELPGQVTDQLAAWPPGPQTVPDQPSASA